MLQLTKSILQKKKNKGYKIYSFKDSIFVIKRDL